MSYKVKSLLYFICFLVSVLFYYTIGDETTKETEVVVEEVLDKKIETLAHHKDSSLETTPIK